MEILIPLVAIIFVIGVPVLAFATRFALRPLVRDLTQALGPGKEGREMMARLEARIARLEKEDKAREEVVNQLAEAEHFRRQLESGKSPAPSARQEPG